MELGLRHRVALVATVFATSEGASYITGVTRLGKQRTDARSLLKPGLEFTARRVTSEVAVPSFDHEAWGRARAAHITRYWSGAPAPAWRHAEARAIWSDEALTVRFVCRQAEPLVIAEAPCLSEKSIGLWDRDVCEMFVAPDARQTPDEYFEFEAAPTGEWLDLGIRHTPSGRETDWHYDSGMIAAARVATDSVTIMIRVSWGAFGRVEPKAGERWRVNLFRCVGTGGGRGYLAWQPTRTPQPNFHVPKAFGWLLFEGMKNEE